jgi:hypothetical protein
MVIVRVGFRVGAVVGMIVGSVVGTVVGSGVTDVTGSVSEGKTPIGVSPAAETGAIAAHTIQKMSAARRMVILGFIRIFPVSVILENRSIYRVVFISRQARR